jgi:cobalt-zinc-cadmium resistance protein CzcA
VPGAADTAIEQESDQTQLRISVDRQAIARYGINVSDVQDVIELAIGGRAVNSIFEGERKFDITVRYIPEARADRRPSAESWWQLVMAGACRYHNWPR